MAPPASPERRNKRVHEGHAGLARGLGRGEMRKQYLNAFLPFMMLGLMASAAETPATQPASQRNELQRVNVVRGSDEVRVEISAQGAVTPKLSTADSPSRVVVEFPATVMATGQNHITVGSAGVKGVRIGMDGQNPPTTRVVVDLDHACRYELNPSAGGKLVLTLYTQSTAATVTAPKTVTPSLPAPTAQKASPVAAQVIDLRANAKADATPKAPVVAAATGTAEKTPASSSDFVFVEPTYQAKKAAAEVPADSTERSQEAAAKFSDKTAAELLPASMNAAQSTQNSGSSTGITPAVNLAAEQKAQAGQQPASIGPK